MRRENGAVLPFTIACILVLCIVGIGLVTVVGTFSGQKQLSNAVESGTLNVAKMAREVRVKLSPVTTKVFQNELRQADQTVGLDNINNVQARALLVTLNNRSLQISGQSNAQSDGSATMALAASKEATDSLSDALNTQPHLQGYFTSLANKYNKPLLDDNVAPEPKWTTACLNRGEQSNVYLEPGILPAGINATTLPTSSAADGKVYLNGYTPITSGAGTAISFVSFQPTQQPHLVSLTTHSAGEKPVPGWVKPVPNAFRCGGNSLDKRTLKRIAWSSGLATEKPVSLSLPDGFIHIKLKQDVLRFVPIQNPFFGLIPHNKPKNRTNFLFAIPSLFGGLGALISSGTTGAQYSSGGYTGAPNSLLRAIFWEGKPSKYSELMNLLANRANQIRPGTSATAVADMLNRTIIPRDTNEADYWIARDVNGVLKVFNKFNLAQMNPVTQGRIGGAAEGDSKMIDGNDFATPNRARSMLITIPIRRIPTVPMTRHRIDFQAGTGLTGNLLEISQLDQNFVFTGSLTNPPNLQVPVG